jgi:hypothetical protein
MKPKQVGMQIKRVDLKPSAVKQQKPGEGKQATARQDFLDNLEVAAKGEIDSLSKGFLDRMKKEASRRDDAVDTEHWVAICFQTRGQKEAFLRALGWLEHGDKYLDGRVLAAQLGMTLPPDPEWSNPRSIGSVADLPTLDKPREWLPRTHGAK